MPSRFRASLLPSLPLFVVLGMAPALAQPAYMVADLGQTVPYDYSVYYGPLPERLEVDGMLFLFEDDGIHGRELWRSDGTALGTFLIRDICPGSCGVRYPLWSGMTALDDRLLFAADDGVHGVELWITDGTALGTTLVADLRPGYDSSLVQNLTSAGSQAFFVAQGGAGSSALWRTDGTAKGTYAITPPGPPGNFSPSSIHPAPGFLYLCNASWGGQAGLWRSDGSSMGTTFVAPVACFQSALGKRTAMAVDNSGVLLFEGAAVGSNDMELWRSDGSASGTYRVKDISPGADGSYPFAFAWRGTELLFIANGGSTLDLWRSDGTESGTTQVLLADGATSGASWGAWAVAGNKYYFAAHDDAHGLEPWVYDGAAASRIVDLIPGPDSGLAFDFFVEGPPLFEAAGYEAFFSGNDGIHGREIWRTDGTTLGTVQLPDLVDGPGGIRVPIYWPLNDAGIGGRLVVLEHQPTSGERLWRIDPPNATVEVLKALNFQTPLFEERGTDRFSLLEASRGFDCFERVASQLQFERRRPEASEVDLLRTDGTLSGTEEILHGLPWREEPCGAMGDFLLYARGSEISPNDSSLLAIETTTGDIETLIASGVSISSRPAFLPRQDRLNFLSGDSLFATDGTAAGTIGSAYGFDFGGGRIEAFLGEVAVAGLSLWITDPAEVTGVRRLLEGNFANLYVETEAAALGSTLVFAASDPDYGTELWTSDGSEGGTAFLLDANPGPESLFHDISADRYVEQRESRLVGAETYAVFAGRSSEGDEELWVTDGTAFGTGLLRDIYPGDYPSTPRQFTRLGSRIVFSAEDEEHGLELWVTDGTYPGTALLKDVAPGLASSIPDDLVVRDGLLYFSAWSPSHGREAWKSDGTNAGTVRISDVAPGPLSSSPQRFARAGNRLYFSATDQVHGYELWAISDDGTIPLFLDGFENNSTSRWSGVIP